MWNITEEEQAKLDAEWALEVYRNTHNLCVYCGKKATRLVFFDVPVCDDHVTQESRTKKLTLIDKIRKFLGVSNVTV